MHLVTSRAQVSAIVLILAAMSGGCSASTDEGSWLAAGGAYGESPPGAASAVVSGGDTGRVELLRQAIQRGLTQGKKSLTSAVRAELSRAGVLATYTPTARDGVVPVEDHHACPFLAPAPAGASVDCRAVVTRAAVTAYASAAQARTEDPLDERFAPVRAEASFWNGEGYTTGVDNEATAVVHDLRAQKLCDTSPTPAQSAHEAGVARGRQIYVAEVNKRFAELGMPMQYPTQITQITQCAANTSLLEPARTRALSQGGAHAISSSLCSGYSPSTPSDVAALADADHRYADGVSAGIATEHSLAAEAIFRVVPCNVGDPLVFDLAGDGVSVVPLTETRAEFDLFGTGEKRRVAWVRGDDALLALDRNGNGRIDDGRELFGDVGAGGETFADGWVSLSRYDGEAFGGNGDGVIDAKDSVFVSLRLFRDDDGDGVSQDGELLDLAHAGVAAIDLRAQSFVRTGWAARTLGTRTGSVADVWLTHGRTRLF